MTIKHTLKHKKNAYITSNLREGIQELMKNKELREKLMKNVSKIKVKDWEEIAKEYLKIIRNFLIKECC